MAYNDNTNYWALYDRWVRASEGRNEAPVIVHRWSALCVLAAFMERRVWIKQGMFRVYPNMYVQLLGEPASKKSTAIKTAKRLLKLTGYDNFASEKTSMEAFLQSLHDMTFEDFDIGAFLRGESINEYSGDIDMLLDDAISGAASKKGAVGMTRHKKLKQIAGTLNNVHCMIAADEFMDFVGRGNTEFISLLGTFWDWDDGVYDKQITSRGSAYINNPLINILSGNTPDNFSLTFPPEIQGQGFFSRILLIHVVSSGRRIAEMYEPLEEDRDVLLEWLLAIGEHCRGEVHIPRDSWDLIEHIYLNWKDIKDARFARYSGRRQTHLLKLVLLMTIGRCDMTVTKDDIIMANTILSYAENIMPLAMGEFGKGKNSSTANLVMKMINNSTGVSLKEILAGTINETDNFGTVHDILTKLHHAGKIQVGEDHLYYPKRALIVRSDTELIKPSWLSEEEVHAIF